MREEKMAYYVLLSNFTDQGIKSIKDTEKRAEAFKAKARERGVKVHQLLWTLGQHDVVAIAEADDDTSATALALSLASLGNIRTQTLRAFDSADMQKILAKMD
jgi:uncharacterized protein with GYD domain